jgi:pimeloyl-ACP methyl ester carboxylesterase
MSKGAIESRSFSTEQLQTEVLEVGEGPTLLLLHGGGGSSAHSYTRLMLALAAGGYRVVAPNRAGYGASPRPTSPLTLATDLDQLQALLRALPGPVVVVGHSYSTILARELAAREPRRVSNLILIEPAFSGLVHASPDAESQAQIDAIAALTPAVADPRAAATPEWFEQVLDGLIGPGTYAAMSPRVRAGIAELGDIIYQENHRSARDRVRWAFYRRIAQPTLVVSGAASRRMWRGCAELTADAIVNASRALVAGAGHLVPLTHAAQVAGLMLAHLALTERLSPTTPVAEVALSA